MPGKDWDEESESDTAPAPAVKVLPRRGKFDDEESEGDMLDSWDAEEDSEVEREKAKVAAEKKAKADAEALANKKSKAQRVAERIAAKKLLAEAGSDSESEEDEASKRERLRREEKRGDMEHAADLFGERLGGNDDMFEGVGIPNTRVKKTAANAVVLDASDPAATVDLTKLPLFDPHTKKQFETLKETLTPLLAANSAKAQYALFLPEFVKGICQELSSDDIKKVASKLTAFGNERMKEEKDKAKGGKKTKAQKGKVALAGARSAASGKDTTVYDQDDFGDDDFM